ncbi:MAG: right-handed parallel beta-helix repeat-containing protein [Opitutaceae bacterium]|nr:right-handed parallel beta-helix repeat-containing protein [Opitutaceae bacterium]
MHPTRIILGAGLALVLGASSLSAIIDRNGDGLSDVWAALYQPVKGAAADEDGDGFSNAQEALAGTDPLNAASRFAAALPQTDAAGNSVLRWRGAWGKRYTVQSSTDLKTWTALPETHIGRGQELSGIVRASGAAAEARRYWRVVVADIDGDGDGMTNAEEIELGSDPTSAVGAEGALGMPRVYGAEYFVSPTGNDANPGTKPAPFLTLEKAKAAVRTRIAAGAPAGGIVVWLRGGYYERTIPLDLNASDSGSSAADSVDWRGYPGEQARIAGGRRLAPASFSLVTSASPIWERLDASARGKVRQLNLREQGITNFGTLKQRGFGSSIGAALELFVDAQAMTLARWPDVDETALLQDPMGEVIEIFGTTKPNVGGMYTKIGVADDMPLFQRDGLVDGSVYYLRRMTWVDNGNRGRAWFLTADRTGWPKDAKAWWSTGADLGIFHPDGKHSDAGAVTALNPARLNHGYAHTADPAAGVSFSYVGERPSRWRQAPDAWVDGYWAYTWAEYHLPIAGIDTDNRKLTLLNAPYSYGIEADQPWYAYNLLEEITQPGEWYLDRASGILYLWPPDGFVPSSDVVVSLQENALFALHGTTNISFRDLTLEATRSSLINVSGGKNVTLARLLLRNSGSTMASVAGESCLVRYCRLTGAGGLGIGLDGGDRKLLTPGNVRMEDCEVDHFARFVRSGQTGVSLSGCGNTLRHSWIHDTPQGAVDLKGNEHRVEFNEIHDVGTITTDAGAVYSGRDWGARGNVIRHNFIHRLHSIFGADLNGIYLDDCVSGFRVEGNILHDITGAAIKAGGGRDSILVNNLLIKCGNGIFADSRAKEWLAKGFPNNIPGDNWNLLERLNALDYKGVTWAARYPECEIIPNDWAAIIAPTSNWLYPEGCVFSRNLGWQIFRWSYASAGTFSHYREIADNVPDADPLFVDEANLLLGLKPGSPVSAIPGWEPIPFARIGVRE